jgi:hypothetical protein
MSIIDYVAIRIYASDFEVANLHVPYIMYVHGVYSSLIHLNSLCFSQLKTSHSVNGRVFFHSSVCIFSSALTASYLTFVDSVRVSAFLQSPGCTLYTFTVRVKAVPLFQRGIRGNSFACVVCSVAQL